MNYTFFVIFGKYIYIVSYLRVQIAKKGADNLSAQQYLHSRSISIGHKICGICDVAAVAQLEMQMVSRRPARRAHEPYLLPAFYLVALLDLGLGHMTVQGQEAVSVVDYDEVAVTTAAAAAVVLCIVVRAAIVYRYNCTSLRSNCAASHDTGITDIYALMGSTPAVAVAA